MNGEFIELEYKFRADEVKLTDFINLIAAMKPVKTLNSSSWDHYYVANDSTEFQRFRNSDTPELTLKRKNNKNNSWDRIEVDLPLDPKRLTLEKVNKYLELEGYTENFRIFKNCFIYWLDYVNYVYYHTYDENLNESGRYIEVEINKDKLNEISTLKAFEILDYHESLLSPLGITSKNRLKKNLFEINYKEKK